MYVWPSITLKAGRRPKNSLFLSFHRLKCLQMESCHNSRTLLEINKSDLAHYSFCTCPTLSWTQLKFKPLFTNHKTWQTGCFSAFISDWESVWKTSTFFRFSSGNVSHWRSQNTLYSLFYSVRIPHYTYTFALVTPAYLPAAVSSTLWTFATGS